MLFERPNAGSLPRLVAMDKRIIARWQDWSGSGLEHTIIRRSGARISIDGTVISGSAEDPFAVRYRLECDNLWTLRKAEIQLAGDAGAITLVSDGHGEWKDGTGDSLGHLNGAIDIDLSVSPLTNTLPIHRLRLAKGKSQDILAAYVHFPDLTVSIDPQRYTCLEPMRRYRYESLDSEFKREIEVDSDGLVVVYPGLFKRIF
jgi:hypothetical protein